MEHSKNQFFAISSGVAIGFAITLILFIGYAILLTYSDVTEKNLELFITLTTLISVIVAGFDSAKASTSRGWFWGIMAGAIYAIILFFISSFLNEFTFDSRSATTFFLSIAGGGLGGILGINIKH